jgi:tRNA A-37 threonylcarbamoyl transferase component Bud32
MPLRETCPVDAALLAVASGVVHEPLLDWYALHLEQCDHCCDRIERMNWPRKSLHAAARWLTDAPLEELTTDLDEVDDLIRFLKDRAAVGRDIVAGEIASLPDGDIGPFRIERQIGSGGTSIVYEACDAQLDRRVILKVLRSTTAPDSASRQLFVDEARTLAALNHPNVMPLYQVLWNREDPVLVFPSLAGRTLEMAIHDGFADWRTAVAIVRDIADALAFTHDAGILHRDVKPSNIWLQRDVHGVEKPLLFDFGLAGIAAIGAGTPGYRPPQGVVDGRDGRAADVFSLAVVLFEATQRIAGTPPRVHSATARLILAAPDRRPSAVDARRLMQDLLDDGRVRRRAWLGGVAAASGAALATPLVATLAYRRTEERGRDNAAGLTAAFQGRPGYPFAVSDDATTWCRADDRGGLVVEDRNDRARRGVPRLPFEPRQLALRNRVTGGQLAVAGDDGVVVVDVEAGRIVAAYGDLGPVQGLAWSGDDDSTLVVHAQGCLFVASQQRNRAFADELAAARFWRGWTAQAGGVTGFGSLSRFEYIATLLSDGTVLTWSLHETRTRGLFRIEPPKLGGETEPMLVGWRSRDAFYRIKRLRLTSYHLLPRMTEEIDLPSSVSSFAWLERDVLAFVASSGVHLGRLGCVLQSRPADVLWLSPPGDSVTRVDAVTDRRTLVVGFGDGRVSLCASHRLAAAILSRSKPRADV